MTTRPGKPALSSASAGRLHEGGLPFAGPRDQREEPHHAEQGRLDEQEHDDAPIAAEAATAHTCPRRAMAKIEKTTATPVVMANSRRNVYWGISMTLILPHLQAGASTPARSGRYSESIGVQVDNATPSSPFPLKPALLVALVALST